MTTETNVKNLNLKELSELVVSLTARVTELESKVNVQKTTTVEMTKEHALRILNGDLSGKKHKEAAEALNLTYGQIYSCRLEFTFKDVHKELRATGWKNTWVK